MAATRPMAAGRSSWRLVEISDTCKVLVRSGDPEVPYWGDEKVTRYRPELEGALNVNETSRDAPGLIVTD